MKPIRSDLVPVLAIMAGGVVGLFSLGAMVFSASSDDVATVTRQLLDEDGKLREGVTGTWVLPVDLARSADGTATFVLVQEGTSVSGTYRGGMGRGIAVSGTADDGQVKLFFASRSGVVSYEGRVEGITMEGTVDYGDLGEGTFRGRIRR